MVLSISAMLHTSKARCNKALVKCNGQLPIKQRAEKLERDSFIPFSHIYLLCFSEVFLFLPLWYTVPANHPGVNQKQPHRHYIALSNMWIRPFVSKGHILASSQWLGETKKYRWMLVIAALAMSGKVPFEKQLHPNSSLLYTLKRDLELLANCSHFKTLQHGQHLQCTWCETEENCALQVCAADSKQANSLLTQANFEVSTKKWIRETRERRELGPVFHKAGSNDCGSGS